MNVVLSDSKNKKNYLLLRDVIKLDTVAANVFEIVVPLEQMKQLDEVSYHVVDRNETTILVQFNQFDIAKEYENISDWVRDVEEDMSAKNDEPRKKRSYEYKRAKTECTDQ